MSTFTSPHDRAFGVEIECGFERGWEAAEDLIFSRYGRDWSVGADGTEIEVRTPILEGEAGYDTLKEVMAFLRENGGYVTNSDGMHVHHDAPDYAANPGLCLPLVESWRENLTSIQAMVTPRRRNSYGACPEWSDHAFEALREWAEGKNPYLAVGRNDLNLASLRRNRPSIEIRLHEGTLDGDVAVSWVKFGQKFLFEAAKKKLRKSQSNRTLLSGIRLSPEAMAILLAKEEYPGLRTPLATFEERRRPRQPYVRDNGTVTNQYYDDEGDYDEEYDEDFCDCEMCSPRE